MAGLVLSIGKESQNYFKHIKQNFEDLKGLGSSFEYSSNGFHLVKYRRMYDNIDNNYYDCEELNVSIVGSALYKKFGFDESAKEIGKSILKGESISKIANEIDGHYFISIFLKNQKRVFLITDYGGVINTYLLEKDQNIYISTSMLALAKTFKVTPDDEAILTFIRSGVFLNETTYFKEIGVLKPASIYEYNFENGQFTRNEYWNVPKDIDQQISFNNAADSINKSLMHIINKIPASKAIYDFTGGYDSRFVLSLAYRKEKDNINAFFFGPTSSREAKIVENNCLNLGIKYNNCEVSDDWPKEFFNHVIESNNLCDGLENACVYAPILMTQKWKRKHFQYSVHGLFGELFRQRTWEFEFGGRGKRRPANLNRLIKYRNLSDDFDKSIFSDPPLKIINDAPNKFLEIYRNTNSILDQKAPNTLQLDNIYFSQRARRWGGRNVTTANQIIQPICPLWFRKPLEISMALPPKYKIRCKLMRNIVEKISPKFAKEKMITGTPFVVINLRNIYLFFPGVLFFTRKIIRKIFQILFNRTIWAGLTTPDYDTSLWYKQALKDPRCIDLLDWEKMITRDFYDKQNLTNFIQKAKSDNFHFYGQLGNIITAEMTLRSANLKNAATN